MKKLLILTLVLGLASLANAELTPILTWTDGVCTWTLDIMASKVYGTGTSDAEYTRDYFQQSSGTGGLDPTTLTGQVLGKDGVYDAAGDKGGFWDPFEGTENAGIYWNVQAGDLNPGTLPNQAIGLWFEADVTYDTSNDFIMKVFNGTEFVTVLQGTIPEPMTVLLLGLGGLFLRRRK